MRIFTTGADRDDDENKPDYEGFLSPIVIESFGEYMLKHQSRKDGSKRASDNWQKGIPQNEYMKSMWRHFKDVWKGHRGFETKEDMVTNLNALLFNVQGYLHEQLIAESRALDGWVKVPVHSNVTISDETLTTKVTSEVTFGNEKPTRKNRI